MNKAWWLPSDRKCMRRVKTIWVCLSYVFCCEGNSIEVLSLWSKQKMECTNPLKLHGSLQDPLRDGDKYQCIVSLYHILWFFWSWISRYFLSSSSPSFPCSLLLNKREQDTSNMNGHYFAILQRAKSHDKIIQKECFL